MRHDQVIDAIESLCVITNETRMIIVGTQALHGVRPDAPDGIMYSREIDVILTTKASLANWISDVVGDETPFEVDRGYYIDHVRPRHGLPVFASGWEGRLLKSNQVGKCVVDYLSPADLVITKLGAGRDKDYPFVVGMIEAGIVSVGQVRDLIPFVPQDLRAKVATGLEVVEAELATLPPDVDNKVGF